MLKSLIVITCRFREHQIALSADIEAMFLQVAVPSDDSRCLRFLWREDREQKIEFYEYKRHVFWPQRSPTSSNYALHHLAKGNAKNDESLGSAKILYGRLPQVSHNTPRSNQSLPKGQNVLSTGGFNMTKWITSGEEVNSQIPEVTLS